MGGTATDERLLGEFVHGDRSALGKLARRYELPLLGLAAGLLGGRRDLARDAVQETWLRVIRFGGSFDGRSSFKTWLYRIAINQCRSLQHTGRWGQSDEPLDSRPGAEARPDEVIQTAERNDRLHAAIAGLGAEKGRVLLLCYHQGMTHREAAEILEIPVGTLKSRIHAALVELRERLSSEAQS